VRDYAALVCTPLPTDAFVSVGSVAGALPDTVPFVLERIAQRHLAQTKAPTVFAGVRGHLARDPSGFPIAMPSGRPDLGGVRLAAEEELQVVLAAAPGDGASAAGGAVQLGIGPATRASFAVFGPGQPLGETAAVAEPLSAAPGLEGDVLPAGSDEDADEGSTPTADPEVTPGIGAEGAPGVAPALAGRYEVGLPSGEAWGAAAFVESSLRLSVELPAPRVAPGAAVIVRAALAGLVEEGTLSVEVRLRAPDGTIAGAWRLDEESGIAALLSADATFAGEGAAPTEPGVYALVVEASGRTAAGEAFSRVTAQALIVE
jgi:hypothetical protein